MWHHVTQRLSLPFLNCWNYRMMLHVEQLLQRKPLGDLKIEVIWKNQNISFPLKVYLHGALVLPIATYALETWPFTEKDNRIINSFEMRCLRCMLGVSILDHIQTNSWCDSTQTSQMVWTRSPSSPNRLCKCVLCSGFFGKEMPGWPKKRWRDYVKT